MDKIFRVNSVKSDIYYLNLVTFILKKKKKKKRKKKEKLTNKNIKKNK